VLLWFYRLLGYPSYVFKICAIKRLPSLNSPVAILFAPHLAKSSALIPFYLSYASDTGEHAVLIDWLKFWDGISDTPFN